MKTRDVKTTEELRQLVEARELSHIKVGVCDIDGVLRGKYMARDKFFSALEKGFGFCDVILGWDANDQLYENPGVKYTGWHTGYADASVRLLPSSVRDLPLEDNMLYVLGEFSDSAEHLCPRGILRRVVERAKNSGFECFAGMEYEFFVFDETPQSVREKNYRNMTPLAPGFFGYSLIRATTHSEFYQGLLALGEKMDFPIEGLHEETGPGVLEAAIKVCDAVEAADRAALFKTFTKIYAQKQDKMATFMSKWSPDWPGQSGHIHISLTRGGQSAFYDASQEHNISKTMRHFIGGLNGDKSM